MENGIYKLLLDTLMNYKGIGYISLQYRNKQGELSKRLMNLGAKIENAKKKDLAMMESEGIPYVASTKYTKADWDMAMAETKQSLIKADEVRSEGQKNACIVLNEENGSVKYNMNTQEIYLFGKSEKKEVIEAGVYPTVNSRAKTIAKEAIKKSLTSAKFRAMILKNVSGSVKVNKQVINVDGQDRTEDVIEIVVD
ncbi:MAG TPA: hypothetical protein VNX68_06525 [Nitrosopumilaceae archaeon]|nr:hypothetical protein [Nitrosopumilaceae archaeon]